MTAGEAPVRLEDVGDGWAMKRSPLGMTLIVAVICAACIGDSAMAPSPTPMSTPLPTPSAGATPSPAGAHGCGAIDRPLALLPRSPSAGPADDFADPVTGHRIVRLSRLENGGSNFYFHQNEFNCRGNKLVLANAHDPLGRWLYVMDLETYDIQPLAESSAPIMEVVAPRRNEVVYVASDGSLRATNLDTHATRTIAQLPAGSDGFTVNADETLIAGFRNERIADFRDHHPDTYLTDYYLAHLPSSIYTVGMDSGVVRTIHEEGNWLDHVQFSPTDPRLLLFSHEGPADRVTDRTWAIDAITPGKPRSLIPETVANELVNHEFFSADGTAVFFDHQVPMGGTYSIGRVEVSTGARSDYAIAPRDWGLHYAVSHDGATFASDGDFRGRKLAMLFHVVDGRLQPEPLADLTASTYEFQPLVQFTRDDQWVIYQTSNANLVQVWAVEVAGR